MVCKQPNEKAATENGIVCNARAWFMASLEAGKHPQKAQKPHSVSVTGC